jgi:hypothetical protein
MSALRFATLLVLAVWVGGLVVLGAIAAPTIFAILEAQDPSAGRATAGLVFSGIFQHFQYLAWGLGGTLLLLFGARAALGPRPRRMALRVWTVVAMLGLSVVTAEIIAPRITRVRDSVTGPIAALDDADPRKIEFGRLHGASNGLMLVTVLAGLGLLWAETRDRL